MRSPFPGMDPYLEDPDLWPDFHSQMITTCRELLQARVGEAYWVAIEKRIIIERDEATPRGWIRPDLSIQGEMFGSPSASGPQTDMHAVMVEVPFEEPYEEPRLVVRRQGQRQSVICVLELLSPTNKRPGGGRAEYLSKRDEVLRTRSSLVEIDLLRSGDRVPVVGEVPSGDYCFFVYRGWERPRAWVRTFGMRDPLPTVPVPLSEGEPEAELPLDQAFELAYARGQYNRELDYSIPATPPLRPEDADWARARIEGATGR